MSEHIITVPRWWNYRGYGVHSPERKTPGHITYTTESGHLKIRPGPRKNQFLLRSTMFKPGDLRSDIPALLSGDELATMFDIQPRKTTTELAYTAHFEGEVGIPGKFFRLERFVNFPCPGTGREGDPNFSFIIKDFMWPEITYLIKNFSVYKA